MSDGASIVFDRAVDYYDRTRALPPDVQAQVTELLADELSGRGRCLEPGVGTGRMALPLHGRGIPLVGIDLSLPMMKRLIANAGEQAPFPLLQTDVTRLPFRNHAFGGALLCHVLHLIPAWRDAANELVRVVRPGGVVLVDLGGAPTSVGGEFAREFARNAGEVRLRPGVTDFDELDDAMAALGAPLRVTRAVPITHRFTLNEILGRFESNESAATWRLDDDTRHRATEATRVWAAERYGDLGVPRTEDAELTWRVYDVG